MLFDIRPKTRIDDLYDREKELRMLDESIERHEPVIVVLGIRRVGKTSLVRVYLNSRKVPHIWIDLRSALVDEQYVDVQEVTRQLEEGLSKLLPKYRKLGEKLRSISGISILGLSVSFSGVAKQSTIISILETLNGTIRDKVAIVLDEAQYLRLLRQINFLNIMAYTYDNLHNVSFILTGSEVGLLEDYLRLDDPKSPLYGRLVRIITVPRFTREQAIDFLIKGFKEFNITPSMEHIERIVDYLDGIVGWLALYGYMVVTEKNPELSPDMFTEKAFKLIRSELSKIMKRSKYYGLILKAIAMGNTTWSEIKEYLEYRLRKQINDSTLYRYLKKLEKLSIIRKTERGRHTYYGFEDNLVRDYAKKLRI